MKKLLCVIFTFMFIISSMGGVFADATREVSTVKVSEYDKVQRILNKDASELCKQEAQVIDEIDKNIQYAVDTYRVKGRSELANMGYTEAQIEALVEVSNRLYQKSRAEFSMASETTLATMMPRSAWADVELHVSADPYEYNFDWEWEGRPFTLSWDTIGFAWNDSDIIASRNDVNCKIKYWYKNKPLITKRPDKYKDITVDPNGGLRIKFDLNAPHPSYFAKTGYGSFEVKNTGNGDDIFMVWAYGHKTYGVNGFCLNFGYPSLSIGSGAEKMYENDGHFDLKTGAIIIQ